MRYLEKFIKKDLQKKMVFVGGPRQCGKTTLAQKILSDYQNNKKGGRYFNWDYVDDKKRLMNQAWNDDETLLVFDEIHKYKQWKNWIKGLFDVFKSIHKFLVTGSARLDVYREGGDSLLGRYHYWRLHPFSLDELPPKIVRDDNVVRRFLDLGGFPEPFLGNNKREANRWRRERLEKIVRDDIRDLENIRDIVTLQLFLDSLRSRVGGLVVLANIANDLQIAPKTAKQWLEILERMYLTFSLKPHTKQVARAIQKPPKVYFFDTGDVEGDDGARFENLVATHLLKRCHFLEDYTGDKYELQYLRDKDGREVDFVILKNKKIESLIEAKFSDTKPSQSLIYYTKKLNPIHSIQIVAFGKRHVGLGKTKVLSALEYFERGPWSP